MRAILFTALLAVCSSDKLDRRYLPPPSAHSAGGSSDILQTPLARNQGLGGIPVGSYENEHQGVVVDAAVGTRASNLNPTGLGAPRITYGSKDSKVGEAAFRDKHLQGGPSFLPPGFDQFRPERVQANRDRTSNTVRLETSIKPDSYNYAYETDNGISAGEKAISVNGVRAQGGYSYTGDDGQVYTVTYTADEDGYQPKGAHLPTPPPVPVEILMSLEQNAKDEAAGLVDDGSYDAKKYNTEGDYSDGSDNNGFNDRQSNKFANRPGSNAPSSSFFINRNNQAIKPNTNSQSGFSNSNKDKSQTSDATDFGSSKSLNKPEPFNKFVTNQDFFGKPTDTGSHASFSVVGNRFGQKIPIQSQFNKEYLPPISQQFSHQNTVGQNFGITTPVGQSPSNDVSKETGIPLSQQNLQKEDLNQDSLSVSRPSSYETSSSDPESPQTPVGLNPDDGNKNINSFASVGNSQNNFNRLLPTVFPQSSQTSSILNNIATPAKPFTQSTGLNSFGTQQTIISTNQPSRELTTPFESNSALNLNYNTAVNTVSSSPVSEGSVQSLLSNSQNIEDDKKSDTDTDPKSPSLNQTPVLESEKNPNLNEAKVDQPSVSTQQASNTFQGEIYQYNKPTGPTSNTQGFTQQSNLQGSIDKKTLNNKPSSFVQQSTPAGQPTNTYDGQIYEYNKPISTQPTDSRPQAFTQKPSFLGSTVNVNNRPQAIGQQSSPINQNVNGNIGEIYQYNKPLSPSSTEGFNKQPLLQGFGVDKNLNKKPTDFGHQTTSTKYPTNTNQGEVYQYTKPPTTFGQKPTLEITSIQNLNNRPQGFSEQSTPVTNPANNNGFVGIFNKFASSRPIDSLTQRQEIPGFTNNQGINNRPQTFDKQTTLFNKPTKTNEGEIYQYNRPTTAASAFSQNPTNAIQNSFIQTQPNRATAQKQNFNQFTHGQATVNTSIIPGSGSQKPTSPGTQGPFSQPRPTDASFSPSTIGLSYNQHTSFPPFNTQTYFPQQPLLENKRPSQNTFLQSRPTVPSFGQTTIYQNRQPQGPDNSYYYDKPSIPFQQFPSTQFSQNKFPQQPQFVSQNINTGSTRPTLQPVRPTLPTIVPNQFQTGINQGSVPTFSSSFPTSSNQQTTLPFIQPFDSNTQVDQKPNSQPGSSFAQAFVSTQSFPIVPSLRPQQQTTVQSSSINPYESEIYQYNKPAVSLPTTQPGTNEQKTESAPNTETKPQLTSDFNKPDSPKGIQEVNGQNQAFAPQLPEYSVSNGISELEDKKPSPRPIGSTILGSPCCKSNLSVNAPLQFNKNAESDKGQFNGQPNFKPQEQGPTVVGEKFDVNRKPPTFDSTGYHY